MDSQAITGELIDCQEQSDLQVSLDKLDINRDLNVDILNNICRFVEFDDFNSIKIAFQPLYTENIEFIPETIISTENETIESLDKQLRKGRPKAFDEIDECIKTKITNITLVLAMDMQYSNKPMSDKYTFNEKFLKLYDTPLLSEYINKIDKIYISYIYIDKNHFQELLALKVREVYILINNNTDILSSVNFQELYMILHEQKKVIRVEDLTIDTVKVKGLSTVDYLKSLKKLTLLCCELNDAILDNCLLYTSPSPRDRTRSRMPSSA